MENTWERVSEADDPRRCQGIGPHGQCMNVAAEGSKMCAAHGGNFAAVAEVKQKNRMYALGKWQNKVNKFTDSDELKSLREEIGIMRMMIQERLAMCKTEMDLMLFSGPLSDMIMKAEKLVASCNKMETQLGTTLDKNQAVQLGQEMVEIIGRHLEFMPDREAICRKVQELVDESMDRDEFFDVLNSVVDDIKSKEEILEAIANDIIAVVERLTKTR